MSSSVSSFLALDITQLRTHRYSLHTWTHTHTLCCRKHWRITSIINIFWTPNPWMTVLTHQASPGQKTRRWSAPPLAQEPCRSPDKQEVERTLKKLQIYSFMKELRIKSGFFSSFFFFRGQKEIWVCSLSVRAGVWSCGLYESIFSVHLPRCTEFHPKRHTLDGLPWR